MSSEKVEGFEAYLDRVTKMGDEVYRFSVLPFKERWTCGVCGDTIPSTNRGGGTGDHDMCNFSLLAQLAEQARRNEPDEDTCIACKNPIGGEEFNVRYNHLTCARVMMNLVPKAFNAMVKPPAIRKILEVQGAEESKEDESQRALTSQLASCELDAGVSVDVAST